jgi:hypothetical protein
MQMEHMTTKMFVPREERRPVDLRGFALSDTRDTDVVLSDLSYNGCQLRSDERFETGEVVELRIVKRGLVQAEIRWSDEERAGARFIA